MAVCGIRLLASVLLSVPLTAAARRSSHGAQGRDLQVPGEAPGVYDVHLLVTRHGLSCANIVETWVHKLDAGRRLMHDPLLGGVGIHGCSEGRTAVEAYLHNRSLPPYDAVVSSVLARAMETALLTYPQQAAPLYVVPFIREHAAGLSNAPKEPVEQLADLNASVPYDFRVDYRWVEEFGSQKGSWDQFLHFLEQSFLPDLVSRLGKPPGSKIVLPVVTHSLFMRDSDVGEKCKAAFGENPSGKPLNNQVVEMTYAFHSGEAAVLRAEPGQEASTVLFTIPECGEPRAVGHWRQAGTHEGRPAYASVAHGHVVLRWSEGAAAWQLATASVLGATVLYESEGSELLPQEIRQWKIAKGYFGRPAAKGPVPRIVWKDGRRSLRETGSPCENVYAGVKLTDAAGKLRAPICLEDVGESCIEPINKYAWAPGVLWRQTYEGLIDEENSTIARLQAEVARARQDIEERRLYLGHIPDSIAQMQEEVIIAAHEAETEEQVRQIAAHEARRAELAGARCWSGGTPDASRGTPSGGTVGRDGPGPFGVSPW